MDDASLIFDHLQQAWGPLGGAAFHQPGDPDEMLLLFAQGELGRVASYGLSRFPLVDEGLLLPWRLELVGATRGDLQQHAAVIVGAAFFVLESGWIPRLGSVLERGVSSVGVETPLPHLYFCEPAVAGCAVDDLHLEQGELRFLACVAISEAELQYRRQHSAEALELLLSGRDLADPNRPSAL